MIPTGPVVDADPRSGPADLLLRVAGGVVTLAGGLVVATLVVLLSPLRLSDLPLIGGVAGAGTARLPVAIVVAVGGAVALTWFAPRAVGVRWAGLLSLAGWLTVVVMASVRTAEGDQLLMRDDWVAALAIFGGTVVLVVGMVVGLTRPAGPPRSGSGDSPTTGVGRPD